jgi:nucleotide-binding universal stress UspA family protein
MGTYKHILVATETLPTDETIFDFLKKIASHHNAKLCLMRAITSLTHANLAFLLPSLSKLEDKLREKTMDALAKIADKVGASNQEQIVEVGNSAHVIIEKAKEMNADLIILGNDKKYFFEGIAASVLQHAPCDILAINSGAL